MPRSANRASSIRRSIQVSAPPQKVYDAFRTDQSLSTWYMDGTSVEFAVGGSIVFEGPEGNVRAVFTELVENERVVLEYHAPWWGTVVWELTPTPKGTRVTLTHEGFEGKEEWLDRFTWGWESFLKALKAFVEGRPIK
ncbi:MAG TPA: SRPBCC domain-containing protein [Candidatus Thermoplasmatota archaeon]|nr:SRPBCC domain-containing protein [Candidatus Thermoplasmatota archaeon]